MTIAKIKNAIDTRWLFPTCLLLIILSLLFRFEKQEEQEASAVQIYVQVLSERPVFSTLIEEGATDLKIELSRKMEYFFDRENEYPEGVNSSGEQALLFDQGFQLAEGKTNWGVHTEVCWFRTAITSSLMHEMEFYASNLVDHQSFTLKPGQSVYLYYRLEYDGAGIVCTPSIRNAELFNKNSTCRTVYVSVLLGIYIGLFLYNLFLAFSTKEKTYPPYLAGLFFFSLYLLFREFSVSVGAWDIASASFTLPAYLCILLFTRDFFHLSESKKTLLYGFYILLGFGIISLYIGVLSSSIGSILSYVFSVFLFGFAVWISISHFKQKGKIAFFFLLSWGPALICLVFSILSSLQICSFRDGSPGSFLGSNPSMYLQIAFQMISLSFVLGDQINQEKEKTALASKENNELKLQDSMKKDFIFYISHELRTTLTLVSGGLEGLRKGRFGKIEKEVDSCLVSLQKNEKQLEEYISNLLLFNRISTQKESLKKIPQNITGSFYLLACSYSSLAEARNIHYQNLIDKTKPFTIENNIHLFELMINNLLSNAFKFTREAGEITVGISDHGSNFCCLSICNTGESIPIKKQQIIFKKFHRLSPGIQGMGLGLHMVQQCAELLGGRVEVESKEGRNCFFLFLPLTKADAEPLKDAVITKDQKDFSWQTKTGKILLVEDNPELLEMIRCNFNMEFTVNTAVDGLEALKLLENGFVPDLIISDILMPRMDGITFFKTLRLEKRTNIPFIFLSAVDNEMDKQKLFNLGAVDFLNKPFSLETLTLKVKNLLRWKSQELENQKNDLKSAIMAVFNDKLNPALDPERALEIKIRQYKLSKREEDILRGVLKGLQDKEIAALLNLATSTVSNYLQNIYRKTKTKGRTSLMFLFSGKE